MKFQKGNPQQGSSVQFSGNGGDSRKRAEGSCKSRSLLHDDGLCSQVFETLAMVFAGGSSDERLWGLGLVSVSPAPDTTRLLVQVYPIPGAGSLPVTEIHAVLKAAKPYLRREIGQAICRKRIPELTFEVLPGPIGGGENDQ